MSIRLSCLSCIALLFLLSLSGCSSYSISEQTVNAKAQEELGNKSIDFRSPMLSAQLAVEQMHFDLQQDRIDAKMSFKGELSSLFLKPFSGAIHLKLTGTPAYDADKKLVYLEDYALLDAEGVDSRGQRFTLAPMLKTFQDQLRLSFPKIPVYTMKEEKGLKGSVLNAITDIEIPPGEIKLIF